MEVVARKSSHPRPLPPRVERLWELEHFSPVVTSHLPFGIRFKTSIDRPALHAAISLLIDRHESLRSRLVVADGRAAMVLHEGPQQTMEVFNVAEDQTNGRRAMADFASAPINLTAGHSFRAGLFQLSTTQHILLMVIHHYFSDAWSNIVIVRDLMAIYRSMVKGAAHSLTGKPAQYADFAAWQRQTMSRNLKDDIMHWNEELQDAPPCVIAAGWNRHDGNTDRVPITESSSVIAAVHRLAQKSNTTAANVVCAAFQLVLGRWCGQKDVTTGVIVAARQAAVFVDTVGYLVNSVPIRTRLLDQITFLELIRQVTAATQRALTHQLSTEILEQVLDVQQPFCRAAFNLTRYEDKIDSQLYSGDALIPAMRPATSVHRDINCTLRMSATTLAGGIRYRMDRFEKQTVQNLASDFIEILKVGVAAPYISLADAAAHVTRR